MKEIISKCKCGVFFSANEHEDYYETAEEWLINQIREQSEINEIGEHVWLGMVTRNNVLRLQFYPNTPIGFYVIYHYDYDELIKKAKDILKHIREGKER